MSISRFSNPAEQPLIDTYVPVPYQELSLSLNRKQGELDKAKEQEFQLRNLAASLKADPLTNQYVVPEVMGEYTSKLNELSERIAKGDDIGYKQEVGRVARQWINDPRVKAIKTSKENYDKYQEDAAKNKDKMADFYDPYRTNFAQNITQYQPGSNVPTFNYEGMKYRQDYVKPADDLMKGIAKDGRGWESYKKDAQGNLVVNNFGQLQKNDGSWEKVTSEKVQQIAKANTDAFLSTDGGRYFVNELLGADIDYDNLPKEVQQQVRNEATNHLYKIGSKQIFADVKSGTNLQNLSDRALDKLDEQQEEFSFSGALAPAVALADGYKVDIPFFDSTTGEKGGDVKFKNNSNTNLGFTTESSGGRGGNPKVSKAITFTKDQEVALEKAQNKFKRVASDPKDKAKLINEYLEDWKKQGLNVNIKYYTIDDRGTPDVKKIEADNRAFFGEDQKGTSLGLNRTYKLMSGEGDTELNGNDFFKKFNDKKYSKSVVGELTPDNPYFVSGKQVQVKDEDGNLVATYAMNGARKESAQNEFKHKFYQAKYNPIGQTKVKLIPSGEDKPKEYIVDYEPITDGSYDNLQNVGSRARLLNADGSVIKDKDGNINPASQWFEDSNGRSSIDILYNSLAE